MGLINDVKESIESFFNRKDKRVIMRDVHGDFTQIGNGISFFAPHVKNGISVNKQLQITRDLQEAASNGDVEELVRLIPVSDPKAHDSLALRRAAQNGHAECVRLLIPVSDPKSDDSYALRMAATYGHAECVKLLLHVSDPKADDSSPLRWAAHYGHAECVKLLIPFSDPLAGDSWALTMAATFGHTECVKALIPVSDLVALREYLYDEDSIKTLDQAEAELVMEQRERLTDAIGLKMEDAPVKKRRM